MEADVFFKVKLTTRMVKVVIAYSKRKYAEVPHFRFFLDGERIPVDATPFQPELRDNDQIHCLVHQQGG